MKVNYVKTVGFRKFEKEFETKLFDTTVITGKNKSGKSNILYAIVNTLLGTNLSGDEKSSLINKNSDSSYGELHFTDNRGENHVLIRGKNKYSSKGNFISIDGKPTTQNELTSFYKDKRLFLSVINPMYFLNKKPAEQKELVDKYLSDVKPKVIFDMQEKQMQDRLLEKYYKNNKGFNELTDTEKEKFINDKMFSISMDIAYNKLDKDERDLLEGVPVNIPAYISELNNSIKKAESKISSYEGKIEYAEEIANQELPEVKTFEKDEELSIARQELAFLNNDTNLTDKNKQKKVVEELEKNLLSKETECSEVENSMKAGKKKYLSIKNGEITKCPTCNQEIHNESKDRTVENMRNELFALYDKKNILDTEIKDIKLKLTMERCKFHSISGNPDVEKEKRIKTVQENITKLEYEKAEIDRFNNSISIKGNDIESALQDIKYFNLEKNTQLKLIDNLNQTKKIAQKLYILYIEEKMKLAREYLKDVDIKFYSVLKTTGEIKEDFIITYKDKTLSDLSRSETIATALEFANMFNKISRLNGPIFIDDYESCVDYDFIKDYSENTQLIIAKVEKGQDLQIQNYFDENAELKQVA
ncbi:MAG: hypothetical protein IJK18_05530 [Clostridia bacterium]|nr:hypothetical protein [Clostridia bacterium]